MPEEEPLQSLRALQLVFETELVVLVGELQEIQELGRGFHHGERWILSVIDYDRDAAVWIKTEEPVFLLLVGGDVSWNGCQLIRRPCTGQSSRQGGRAMYMMVVVHSRSLYRSASSSSMI